VTAPATAQDVAKFYGAAVLGLRALDTRERSPRRFGADADARWMHFAGALGSGDRIDILLRDAAATWGAAFSPSECFGFFGLADDDPFGPDWSGIDDRAAKRLLAEVEVTPTLEHIATGLGVQAMSISVPPLSPSTKLVIAGGAAIVAVAKAFSDDGALSWTDQVVAVAEKPGLRQLAALAAVVLGARGRTVLVRPAADAESAVRALGFAHVDLPVVSPDAESEAAELARKLGGK
jgi:hypothetical protein